MTPKLSASRSANELVSKNYIAKSLELSSYIYNLNAGLRKDSF